MTKDNTMPINESRSVMVTVLIAVYNHGSYIGEAIESVWSNREDLQNHQWNAIIEIIVMDDGSTDHTRQVVQQYMRATPKGSVIKYFYQNNQGQAAAYQNSLEYLSGDFVMLLDSDDRFLPNKIRTVLEAFEQYPNAGFVGHPLYVIDSYGTNVGEVRPKLAKISEGDISSNIKKYGRNVAPPTSGLSFRRDLFVQVHPSPLYGLPSAADAYLSISISLLTTVVALKQPLAEYRQHDESQYIKRLTSIEGLKRTVTTQKKILNHLQLQHTLKNNSYFMRHQYVLVRMENNIGVWFKELLLLEGAIFKDPFLSAKSKWMMIGYWSLSAFMSKKQFWKYWLYFQIKHTGNKSLLDTEKIFTTISRS